MDVGAVLLSSGFLLGLVWVVVAQVYLQIVAYGVLANQSSYIVLIAELVFIVGECRNNAALRTASYATMAYRRRHCNCSDCANAL